jgi:hypothetical protein
MSLQQANDESQLITEGHVPFFAFTAVIKE